MTRKKQRDTIFKLLFQIEFIDSQEIETHVNLLLDEITDQGEEKGKKVNQTQLTYIKEKFYRILSLIKELDHQINDQSTGWRTGRMNKVDLSILRLALFEIKYDDDIPVGVAINEAVELAKKYSGEEGPAFVNGVLAKFV